MKRELASLVASIFLATGISIATSSNAMAVSWPENCSYALSGWSTNGSWAKCTSGGGEYKANIGCQNYYDGSHYLAHPPEWKRPGATSWVFCPPGFFAYSAGITKRSS